MRTAKEFFDTYYYNINHFNGSYDECRKYELQMFSDWYHEMDVGDKAHVRMWSDECPVTIIKKTATTLTVRKDKAVLDPNWKPEFVLGGFSAHCTNNDEQKWIISDDPDGDIEVFRWSKRLNCFKDKCDCKLLPGWAKVHDYNF